jgi:hypothetical protein
MNPRTQKKINKIQEYLRTHYQELFGINNGNIVGVRVGRKKKADKIMNYNAVIFHVISKTEPLRLEDGQLIPARLNIVLEDGTAYNLPTDVEEVGEFQFQYAIGDNVDDNTVGKEGTLGLFLTDGVNAYALTNYHVAGWNLMQQGYNYYDQNTGLIPDNLTVSGVAGLAMYYGQISKTIDAAFINLGPAGGITNNLGGGNQVNNQGYVDPDSLKQGDTLIAYRNIASGSQYVTVASNSVQYDPQYKGILFDRVIALDRYSEAGDSGSLVVAQDFRVVGIVVGADKYSYLIPFSAIYAFSGLNII